MALLFTGVTAFALFITVVVLSIFYFSLRLKFAKFSEIDDAATHLNQIKDQTNELKLNAQSYAQEIAKSKQVYAKYTEVLGVYKSAAEVKGKLESLKAELEQYRSAIGVAKTAAECQAELAKLQSEVAQWKHALGDVQMEVSMQEIGLYKRMFNFETPEKFRQLIDDCVEQQKDIVKAGRACICSANWVVEGSEAKGKKMMQEQIKLMLRAFNGECDSAISKIKHGNFAAIDKRIQKAFETLNTLGKTKQISIDPAYFELKRMELRLTHELELAKEEEKQRQRDIREQMAEEAKAEKEIEDAKRKAERDEETKTKALDQARKQLALEHGKHNEKLEQLIAKLENELSEAIDRKAKAIARAQLTKSGYVYILSNLGTMGPNVYKIGMTRRLEPLERVAELGDASVPFPFDVHAMIFSEDAPALEATLHRHFAEKRVNLVNLRKEYFAVTLDEIREAVTKHFGRVTFLLEPDAEQFKETLAIRAEKVHVKVA